MREKHATVSGVMEWIEELAPAALAESWDRVGLQCGAREARVSRALTALTVSGETVDEAVRRGAEMIVAHHPLIFEPLEALLPETRVGSLLYKMIRSDIALGVTHTNLDKTCGGVSDGLARRIGLSHTVPLIEDGVSDAPEVKLVTFVPEAAEHGVRDALAEAGAGVIGRYSHCAFSVPGKGSFRPLSGSTPHIGTHEELTWVNEVRLESVVERSQIRRVVKALDDAHPYEEVPVDIYPLQSARPGRIGIGRIGNLSKDMCAQEFVEHVKKTLALPWCRVAGNADGVVSRVAVVGGSGGGFVKRARAVGADALVTGDVDYHDADEAAHLGILVVDGGHFGTEKHVPHDIAAYLRARSLEAGSLIEVDVFGESDVFSSQ